MPNAPKAPKLSGQYFAGLLALGSLTLVTAAHAAPPPSQDPMVLTEVANQVDTSSQRATLEHLVGFGTRHTASDTASSVRGIGAARGWVKSRFEAIGKDCGGCLSIETVAETITAPRLPKPTEVVDVLAIQKGTESSNRVLIISGHVDSIRSDVMDSKGDAPGANDDGSGTTVVLEAARVLSRYKFPVTLVYAVLSGEEQGLQGGGVLARTAKARGWDVEAVLNNDIVGNIHGLGGVIDNTHVRVFSEGTRGPETPEEAALRRRGGGENDSPSRNLSRYMADIAAQNFPAFGVRQIFRADRLNRGGDHEPMLQAGFPAVRVTEAAEDYTRQHQDVRVQDGVAYGDVLSGVDFPYLAQVTKLNVMTLASLAWAPPPPRGVEIAREVPPGVKVTWTQVPGSAGYRIWWRDTDSARWTDSRWVGDVASASLPGVNIDDKFIGISAVSANGFSSPVEFPGPAGAFQITRAPKP